MKRTTLKKRTNVKHLLSLGLLACALSLAVIMIIAAVGFPAAAHDGKEVHEVLSDPIQSADGRYEYVINQATGEAYFGGSLEKDIAVLNIPDEIDGHKIVAVWTMGRSNLIAAVNFGKNIQEVFNLGSGNLPFCQFNFNDGLKVVNGRSLEYDNNGNSCIYSYDQIIFPATLTSVELPQNINMIVFQSDPKIDMVITDNRSYLHTGPRDIYFTGNALNVDAGAFDLVWHDSNLGTSGTYPSDFIIHHKPGAKGFEKFAEHGYTVKEYTHEFWNDPPAQKAEIETITLSNSSLRMRPFIREKGFDEAKLSATFSPKNVDDDRIFFAALVADNYKPCARVDLMTGRVTAIYEGTATIRAVASSGAFADCVVTVGDTKPAPEAPPKTFWQRYKFWILGGAGGLIVAAVAVAVAVTVRKKRRQP